VISNNSSGMGSLSGVCVASGVDVAVAVATGTGVAALPPHALRKSAPNKRIKAILFIHAPHSTFAGL
jgi:hypothetical protein